VRPLYDDGARAAQAATRDYVLKVDGGGGTPARLDIYGGKITTYRRLAEHALEKLAPHLPGMGKPWTAGAALPGGEFPPGAFEQEVSALQARHPFLGTKLALRLMRVYGTRAERVLGKARSMQDLGRDFGQGLTEAEVDYLRRDEFALAADDILWRRSKVGLHLSAEQTRGIEEFLSGSSRPKAASA
jgi:glycerol-3-phosphate dehydrogenase